MTALNDPDRPLKDTDNEDANQVTERKKTQKDQCNMEILHWKTKTSFWTRI